MELLLSGIEHEAVFVFHHLIDDIVLEPRRAWRYLYPLFLGIELFLAEALFVNVVHLAESHGWVGADIQRLDPRRLLVVSGVFDLVAQR